MSGFCYAEWMERDDFTLPIRVYYEDTDAGGVVYHSNYLNFMERARTEMLRKAGFEQDELAGELGIVFVVSSLELKYHKPAKFNDQLLVSVSIEKLSRVSIRFKQTVYRQKPAAARELLCSAVVVVACVSATTFKPVMIPVTIKEAIQ